MADNLPLDYPQTLPSTAIRSLTRILPSLLVSPAISLSCFHSFFESRAAEEIHFCLISRFSPSLSLAFTGMTYYRDRGAIGMMRSLHEIFGRACEWSKYIIDAHFGSVICHFFGMGIWPLLLLFVTLVWLLSLSLGTQVEFSTRNLRRRGRRS